MADYCSREVCLVSSRSLMKNWKRKKIN